MTATSDGFVGRFIALVVAVVWAVVALASVLTKEYTPITVITPVMVAVVGLVLGQEARRSRKEQNGNGNGKK